MAVNGNRLMLDELDDMALGTACFKPLIDAFKEVRIQGGDESKFYENLTAGQQTLFIFRVYYDHVSKSPVDLYWWSAYFYAQPARWSSLKSRLHMLKDNEMITLLHEIERELAIRTYPRSLVDFKPAASDLEQDSDLSFLFSALYARLHSVTSLTIERLARYIRQHPHEFIPFIGEGNTRVYQQ
ncbi:hypothetical protein [Paenibacillus spongiae]|uniref:Uncharacterized protein n=1 Tax=Paenibacillus spongiae TaxID=2909671 RepID=A0ABY5SG11_9BACL|nr:hypothetical protein [Paenibacillus spongiae]UVI32912.1 hypothetical protein L1F29_14215 [Paenibacillus spongiae]